MDAMNDVRRALTGVFVLAAFALAPNASSPAPTDVPVSATMFMLDPAGPISPEPRVLPQGSAVLGAIVRAERVVRLEDHVDLSAVNAVGFKTPWTLDPGYLLMGSSTRPGVFCAPIKSGLVYATAPCLIDADGDGRFEAAQTAAFSGMNAVGMAVSNGPIFGVTYSPPARLPTTVGYVAGNYRDGPSSRITLFWKSDYRSNRPDLPVEVQLWLRADDPKSGTGVYSATRRVILAHGEGQVEAFGVSFHVTGFDYRSGAMRIEAVGMKPAQPVLLAHVPRPKHVVVVVP
ncbi:MAG TPA: hypothetical protein VG939_14565 [Caulobacteraceae bacterium]|nr:hypothetical protein [Caulobacteraceae bacterium]